MLGKKVARRGNDGTVSTSVPHPMRGLRDMIIQERQTLCRHFLEHARQESEKPNPKLAIVNLGHVVRNFHDDEKNWIRLYEAAAEEQNSTGLLNERWMRELVMEDASQTVFFTFLPLYRSGSKAAAGKKHKVSRKTVCGGTWEVKAQEFTSTYLTGQKFRFTESRGKISMSMLEITLTESDPTRVSLCLVYKGGIESSAAFIMGPIGNCLPQIPYLPHGIDYPTNQDHVQFAGQHNFLGAATDEKSSDGADDSKSSLKYSEAPKNCTQMGIGNIACSSSNMQSKSLRDILIHAASCRVDAYLQDYPLEAAKITDLSEENVKHMLIKVIVPHIMESEYSVDENERLGKRKVGPEGSSQVFEENKKAHIYEEPNNIENNLMHDFSNRGTPYSFDPSGISQAPQTDEVTTQLSQHQPHIKTGPTSTSVGYRQYSGGPTNHAARGNEEQQNAPSEYLLRNEVFISTQDPLQEVTPLQEVVQPYLGNDSDASLQNQPPQLPPHPATEVAHTVELGLQYPTTMVATSPSNGFHDNDAVAQKRVLISTNQYDSSVEYQFQRDLQAIGGNTSHTVPGQADLQPVPDPQNHPELNARNEESATDMHIPTQDQVQHFPPVGINEIVTFLQSENDVPNKQFCPQQAKKVFNEYLELIQPQTGMSHQADEPNNEVQDIDDTALMTRSSQNWNEYASVQNQLTQLPQHPKTEVAHNDAVTQKAPFPQDMRVDESPNFAFPDDDNGPMQNQMDQLQLQESLPAVEGAGSGNNDVFEDLESLPAVEGAGSGNNDVFEDLDDNELNNFY